MSMRWRQTRHVTFDSGFFRQCSQRIGMSLRVADRSCGARIVKEMAPTQSVVFVIDDDVHVREGLSSLLRSVGLRVELFGSTAEFAQRKPVDVAGCLVLDVRLPGLSGLDF